MRDPAIRRLINRARFHRLSGMGHTYEAWSRSFATDKGRAAAGRMAGRAFDLASRAFENVIPMPTGSKVPA